MGDYFDPMEPTFQGMPVFFSDHALDGMDEMRMTKYDVLAVLEEGVEFENGKRRAGTIVRCSTHRGKRVKVVAKPDYQYSTRQDGWLITYVGETGRL